MKKHLKFGLAAALAMVALFSLAFAGSRSAWLGVYTQEVDEDLAEDYSLATDHGAIIDEVVEDSPAEEAGLKEDDIIIAFDGKVVRDDDDLTDLVLDSRPGDTVSLTIVRDSKEQQIKVELGRRPRSYGWYGDRGWFDAPRTPRVPKIPKIPKIPAPVVPDYYYFHGDDEYPYIGVSLLEISRKTAISLGADRGGVLIDDVEKNSPAEKAGLQAGDLIVTIDDEKIFDAEDVQEIIRDKDEGDVARITYIRDRKQSTVDVKVALDEDRRSYGRSHSIRIPDMPDIDIKAPKLQYLHQGRFLDSDDFDSDEFKEAMKEYQKELKKLKIEMKDLKKSLH
jgi:S1-C subfamily serine protease